ncbi:uncharacterized protein LOC110633874 [Hevea brasiliensis]|uniref:uncharacterized protein LOC110633874 n=1 Tax=Hevea brasiliensis TaxID=3981 RepID=UPI0025DA0911|nr:uncharacterized protein LOC110633874 [Hevea brasiliensis]
MAFSTPATNITTSINSIPMLNGTNFKAWQESVMITLGVMDLDHALRVLKLANLTDKNTSDEKKEMEKWEKSNRISLMVIKRAIPEAFRGNVSNQVDTTKAFLEDIEKRFAKNEKLKLEEDRLKHERTPSAHLDSTTKDKRKDNRRKKKKEATETTPQKKQHN